MKKDINAKKEENRQGRRIYGLIAVAGCLAFAAGLLLLLFVFGRNGKEENITCGEWLEMLCEQFDTEYGILELVPDFEEDEYVSGNFIALTAVRTIGDNKLETYLKTDDGITDDACIELAIEYGLIKEKQLKSKFTREECKQVLKKLNSLYFEQFWRDDYSQVAYQEGVVELSAEDVLYSNMDGITLAASDDMTASLAVGDIIVWEQDNNKMKIAREITGISEDGVLSLGPTELEKVVESLVVSDITELTFEDIVNYYGLGEERSSERKVQKTAAFRFDTSSKGFQLSLSTKGEGRDRHLEIQVTDNATGVSYTLPIQIEVEADSEYSAEINIDKIALGAQVNYSALENSFKYADAALDVHAIISGTVKAGEEKTIPLFKTPVPLGNGIVGVDVQINLVLSVEGGISFQAELPMQLAVNYEKGRGFRNTGHGISVENPMLEANCTAGAGLRIEPILVVLGFDVMDVEADIKAQAQAKVQTHSNGQICSDISLALPIVVLSVCGDEDADTIIGKLGISAEWEVLSADNAPFQKGLHYEILPDQTMQFVKKCTYGETAPSNNSSAESGSQSAESNNHGSLEMKNTYTTQMKEAGGMAVPRFMFDYPDGWTISEEKVDNGAVTQFETVRLTNESGTEVYYSYCIWLDDRFGSFFEENATISVLADSSFVPGYARTTDYSNLGKFIIVKTRASDYPGLYYYAVKPESYCGAHSISGIHLQSDFWYDGNLSFCVISVEELPPSEEQEVIAILSSFRVADDGTSAAEEDGGASEEDSLLAALQSGDFSYFAGTYKPCAIYNDWYGGGEDIADLVLQEDGVIVGGGTSWNPNRYPETEPIMVKKNEDGSYLCQVSYSNNNAQKYFLIYPEGVIGENPYIYNDPMLTKTVYIQYMTIDGGVSDIIYYKVEDD